MDFLSSLAGAAGEALTGALSATSEWGSLHPDLIARIKPCDDKGEILGPGIAAPVKEGSMEQAFKWLSPFESINPESKHPTFMAAVQSGGIGQALQTMSLILSENKVTSGISQEMAKTSESLQTFLEQAKGRTGITKMNSRQVFAGHDPMKIQVTLLFRALMNPKKEVEQPFWELMRMAFPEKLANDYLSAFKEVQEQEKTDIQTQILHTLFPSKAPGMVAFTYKGETYKPFVIESIGKPMDAPYSPLGDLILEVPVTLGSLSSLDNQDLAQIRQGLLNNFISDAIAGVISIF